MESDVWIPYFPYGVMVLSVGYGASVPEALAWQNTHNLTYPVLSDQRGDVTLTYTNLSGSPLLPWDAIVTVDRFLAYTADSYAGGQWLIGDIEAVLDSLFDPQPSADPTELDFGNVEVGGYLDLTTVLDNAGTGLLEVQNVTGLAVPFSATPTQGQVYAVDDSLIITVRFAPTEEGSFTDTVTIVTPAGNVSIPVSGSSPSAVEPNPSVPRSFEVACFPNPFNAELTVQIALPGPQEVSAELYTVSGDKIGSLYRGWMNGGAHKLRWADEKAPSGIYLLKVAGEDWQEIRKVVLVR